MIRVFCLESDVLFSYSVVYEVNHVVDWRVTDWESHCSHVRVLPLKEVFIVGVSLYSTPDSVCSLNNFEFQVGKTFFVLKMLDDESGIQGSDSSTQDANGGNIVRHEVSGRVLTSHKPVFSQWIMMVDAFIALLETVLYFLSFGSSRYRGLHYILLILFNEGMFHVVVKVKNILEDVGIYLRARA